MPPTGERLEIERLTSRSERDRWKSTREGNSLTAYSTASTVLNGEVAETGRKELRRDLTQRKMRGFSPRFVYWGISATDSHQTDTVAQSLF